MLIVNRFIVTLILILVATTAIAKKDALPEVSHDGLHLQKNTKLRAVYMKPGADLSEFTKVKLLEPYVAFKKNWRRDHNRDEADLGSMVSDKDMQNIRDRLAKQFMKVFTKEISTKGGYQIVDTAAEGVLIVRPAIINLDVVSPDIMTSGMSRTYSADMGQMTLYMELYDGKTNDIIFRVIDPEAGQDGDMMQMQNRVTNTAAADRILDRWAKTLTEHLGSLK